LFFEIIENKGPPSMAPKLHFARNPINGSV